MGRREVGSKNSLRFASVAALLSAQNLTKHYGEVVALNDVSFDISDGITRIMGENGAGKSTAIKIFLGLLKPTSGSAMILGENASENIIIRSRLGYMPEHDCLPSNVTAAEFLTHMAEVSGLPPSNACAPPACLRSVTGRWVVIRPV